MKIWWTWKYLLWHPLHIINKKDSMFLSCTHHMWLWKVCALGVYKRRKIYQHANKRRDTKRINDDSNYEDYAYKIILMKVLTCNISKFADDMKITGRITTSTNKIQLQSDLDILVRWQKKDMKFNVDKCRVLHIRNSNYHTIQ